MPEEPSVKESGIQDFLNDSEEPIVLTTPDEFFEKADSEPDVPIDTSEPIKLATVVGGYRYKGGEGRDVMLELGHPAIILLLAYLLTLPGIIMEFFMLKSLWYFGFEFYSIYIFILATGCVMTGFFLLFRKPGSRTIFSVGSVRLFGIALVIVVTSLAMLMLYGRGSADTAILLSLIVVIAMLALLISSPRIDRREGFAIGAYGAGAVIAALVPVHQAFGIWGGGGGLLGFTLLDGALLVIGVSISFIALNSMRMQTSLFSCWVLGATMVALVAFHEFAAIQASGSFEIYDQVLALEGAVFSVVPLSLYFLREFESARLWAHLLNATKLLEKKSYERALMEIERAMELLSRTGFATKLSLPWCVYGDIYYAMGRTSRANTCYEMALQITPTNAEAVLNIGNMHAIKGETELAIASYLKATEIAPEDPKPWNNLGVVYLSQQKFEDALAAFEKAISKDESFPMPYYNAATILQRSGKPAAAMDLLDKLMSLSPADEEFKRAHERGKEILEQFQQAAGWKILGMDVAELVKILIQDPEGFGSRYESFLNRVVSENESNAFGGDRKRSADALQGLLDGLGVIGEDVAKIERKSGLTKYQLKYAVASLILSGKAKFRAINKDIVLIPTSGKRPEPEKEERRSGAATSNETLRKASTLT